jgi:hypothetical protein
MTNPTCSLCKIQTETAETDGEYVCPDCGRIYVPGYEIVEYPDELEPIGAEEQPELAGLGGASSPLVAADDEIDGSIIDQLYKNPKSKPNEGTNAESWD